MTDATHQHEAQDNPLSEHEREVARLLVTGASNAEIANDLVISPHTVKVHLRNIFEKLAVNSRTEASLVLLQRGWVVVPGMTSEGHGVAQEPPPPSLPDVAPLADLPPTTTRVQRVVLVAAVACGLLLLLPALAGLVGSSANWLTDAKTTRAGPMTIQLEPRWEMRTPLDQPLTRLAAVLMGNQLFVLGGEQGNGEPVATVQRYDLATNDWSAVAPCPHRLPIWQRTSGGTPLRRGRQRSRQRVRGNRRPNGSAVRLRSCPQPLAGGCDPPVPGCGCNARGRRSGLYLIGGWMARRSATTSGAMCRTQPPPAACGSWLAT